MAADPTDLLKRYGPKLAKTVDLDRQMVTLRYSPCGKLLVAGDFEGLVRRWDTSGEDLQDLPPLGGHGGWVTALAFHADGRRLFTSDSWGQLRAWPYAEAAPQPAWAVAQAHDGWIRAIACSPDGQSVATCGIDKQIRLWSADGGKRHEFAAGDDVYSLAFHPSGALVSGDLKGVVKHWVAAAGKCVREFDARGMYLYDRLQDVGGVRTLAFDKAGTTLVCGGSRPKSGAFVQGTPMVLWFDWQSGSLKHTLKLGGENDGFVYDMFLHGDGFLVGVSSGQPGSGKLFFHTPDAEQPFFAATTMANCHALAVHPAGYRLAVSATNSGSNGNGRQLNGNKQYPGNFSPLYLWDLPHSS